MPKGKGTYGSKVGRPPQKEGAEDYHGGGPVRPMQNRPSVGPDGLTSLPSFDATQRRNVIPGMTNDMARPQFMGGYDKGGKVEEEKWDVDPDTGAKMLRFGDMTMLLEILFITNLQILV